MLFFISIFIAIGIIYLLLIQTSLLYSPFNYWLNFYISKSYPLKIEIGKLNGSIFNRLILRDVHLLYNTPENKYTLLKTKKIDLRYNPFDFLKGKLIFHYAELDSPLIQIHKKNGKYLLPQPKKKKRIVLTPPKSLYVKLDTLLLNGGTFTLQDDSHPIEIENLNLFSSFERKDKKNDIEILFCNFEYPNKNLAIKKIEGEIQLEKDTIFLSDLILNTGSSKITTSGILAHLKNPELNLDIKTDPLNLDELSQLIKAKLSGEFKIDGKLEGNLKSFKGEAMLSGDLFERAFDNVDVEYSYKNKILNFGRIRGEVFKSYLSGSGKMDFREKPENYSLDVQVKNLYLPNIVPTSLTTDFSGKIVLDGQGFSEDDFLLNIKVDLEPGKIDKYTFDKAQGELSLDFSSIHFVPNFTLEYQNIKALCQGNLDFQGNVNLKAQTSFPDLSNFQGKIPIKKLGGKGKANLWIGGTTENLNVKAELESDSLQVYDFFTRDFSGFLEMVNFPAQRNGRLLSRALSGSIWGIDYDSLGVKLDLEGDLLKIDTLCLISDETNISLRGKLDNSVSPSELVLEGLRGNFKDNFFETTSDVKILLDKNFFEAKDFELKSNIGSFVISGKFDYPDKIDFKASFSEVDLFPLSNTFLSQKDILGVLEGNVSINQSFSDPVIRSKTVVSDFKYKQVDLGKFEAEIFYKDKKINLEKLNLSHPDGTFTIQGYLPFFFSVFPLKTELLNTEQSFQVKGKGEELKIFYPFLSFIEYIKGPFETNIEISGTPQNREIDGQLKLNKGTMKFNPFRDPITNLDSELKLENNILTFEKFEGEVKHKSLDSGNLLKKIWRFFFPKKIKKGELAGFGKIEFRSLKDLYFDLYLAGADLPLNYEYLDLSAVSDLNMEITGPNPPALSGELLFHQLHFKEPFSVLFITTPQEEDGNIFDFNFNLSAVNNCWILNEDMNLEFKGDVLVQREKGDLNLLGELETIRGKYFLFGTSFKIKNGKFIFDNLEEVDPKLDFLVSADMLNPVSANPMETQITSGSEKIELAISGSLSAPEVNPAPDSPYSKEEALELLTFGQRLSALDTLGTKSLFQERVVKSLGMGYGGRILENLAIRSLGVETFEIRPAGTGKFNLWDTEITLGKYVSEKIYLKYTRSLSQSRGDETGAEYRINRHLFFEGYKDKTGKFHLGINLSFEY